MKISKNRVSCYIEFVFNPFAVMVTHVKISPRLSPAMSAISVLLFTMSAISVATIFDIGYFGVIKLLTISAIFAPVFTMSAILVLICYFMCVIRRCIITIISN